MNSNNINSEELIIDKDFIYTHVDPHKLKSYLSDPKLDLKESIIITYWLNFQQSRFMYFYLLCDHFQNIHVAYNQAKRDDQNTITNFIKEKTQ